MTIHDDPKWELLLVRFDPDQTGKNVVRDVHALGFYPAPDREAAEAVAADKFNGQVANDWNDFVVLPANTSARVLDLMGTEF